jgi:hypothetical protein
MSIPVHDGPRPQLDGTREALKIGIGLGAGLIPAACAIAFFASLCPISDTTCNFAAHDTINTIRSVLFVGAVVTYLLQVLATVVCAVFRATRPIALGMLIMLVLGPLLALLGSTYVSELDAPRAAHVSALQVPGAGALGIAHGSRV